MNKPKVQSQKKPAYTKGPNELFQNPNSPKFGQQPLRSAPLPGNNLGVKPMVKSPT